MGNNDRQDAANDQAISEESEEQQATTRRIEKDPEPTNAPAPGDDIIIK